MDTMTFTPSAAERYIAPLINLSDNVKLEIISKLTASMMKFQPKEGTTAEQVDLRTCFRGDWGNGQSTEDYCRELRTDAFAETEETETW